MQPPISLLMNFDRRIEHLERLAQTGTRKDVEDFLTALAKKAGDRLFQRQAADDLLAVTTPEAALPEVYAEYRPVVKDGIRFLFSHLSVSRLISLIADQAQLPRETPIPERIVRMAVQVPTLHKLGQILARNRNMDPDFRKWLIRLESGDSPSEMAEIHSRIENELGDDLKRYSVAIGDSILAEASVGLVVPFTWLMPGTSASRKGVFKMLKPGVMDRLTEELEILKSLGHYYEERRDQYGLEKLRFAEVFDEIAGSLIEEIDLFGEQSKLKQAKSFYRLDTDTEIPSVLPFSKKGITAMDFITGDKVTDAKMSLSDRRKSAGMLFNALIWKPLFSSSETACFHGDPHAGNLFAAVHSSMNKSIKGVSLGLLDWSLAGTLSRADRSRIVLLMLGTASGNRALICDAVRALSPGEEEILELPELVAQRMASEDYQWAGNAKRTFLIIDGLSLNGLHFSKDLLLFRKAFFTLDGVIGELDPDFDMDDFMMRKMGELIAGEIPRRWISLMLRIPDRAEHYRSLISNGDLTGLAFHLAYQVMGEGFRRGTDAAGRIIEGPVRLFFRPFMLTQE